VTGSRQGPAAQAWGAAGGREGGARVRAYVGLGANVGDAESTLRDAVAALGSLTDARVAGVSALYRTKPVGVVEQADFLNAVVALDLPAPAHGVTASAAAAGGASAALRLLVQLKDLERAFGRRQRQRWGPRELDLDLLLYGDARLALERPADGQSLSASIDPAAAARLLEVPHPSMADRLFVLAPLADLAPDLVPPGWRESVGSRAAAVRSQVPDAVVAVGQWDAARRRWA
jgi:2-amino-4-hydroxy-6-hydroxymethyldihydropteridine diphosphokinase